jgi:hypothetical protein
LLCHLIGIAHGQSSWATRREDEAIKKPRTHALRGDPVALNYLILSTPVPSMAQIFCSHMYIELHSTLGLRKRDVRSSPRPFARPGGSFVLLNYPHSTTVQPNFLREVRSYQPTLRLVVAFRWSDGRRSPIITDQPFSN